MISCLIIHPKLAEREIEVEKILSKIGLKKNHPDLLWLGEEEKLGVEQAKKIKEFLGLKPYQGKTQAVVVLAAENLTLDAQNALLKTLEEAQEHASIILGATSEEQLLPTIISRCKIINLQNTPTSEVGLKYQDDIEKLLSLDYEKRFQFIEKLEEKEDFLYALTAYFRQCLLTDIQLPMLDKKKVQNFLKDLVKAEKWAKHNVNIRAILEYLMLKMPEKRDK